MILKSTVMAGLATGALKKSDLKRVTVDTTVQEKAVTYPTDAKLLNRVRERLVKKSRAAGLMSTLQQAQLSGGSILDADMIEMLARIVVKLSGHEVAAVAGDQRRHASGKTAVVRRLPGPSPTFSNSPGRAR